jgi:hypothetical protein
VVSHIPFRDVSIQDVQISLGRTTSAWKIRPEFQVLEMSEVAVSAQRPSIDPTSAAVGFHMVSERTGRSTRRALARHQDWLGQEAQKNVDKDHKKGSVVITLEQISKT